MPDFDEKPYICLIPLRSVPQVHIVSSEVMKHCIVSLFCVLLFLTACTQPATIDQVVGKDKDEYGCKGSAGYTWSHALHDCVRLWEAGERIWGGQRSGFLVYSVDSTFAEVFLSDGESVICRRKKGKTEWRSRSGVRVWSNNGVTTVRTADCTYTVIK